MLMFNQILANQVLFEESEVIRLGVGDGEWGKGVSCPVKELKASQWEEFNLKEVGEGGEGSNATQTAWLCAVGAHRGEDYWRKPHGGLTLVWDFNRKRGKELKKKVISEHLLSRSVTQ